MTAQITTLIEGPDNFELVRDTIAAILLVEQDGQQALARADGKNPEDWRLRVFLERTSPWDEFVGATPDGETIDAAPIVNVLFENAESDASSSNTIERQKNTGTFFIDCYGYGVSRETDAGHLTGDEVAALEAQRAARLVRRILMAGKYNYLGLRGTVWRRWPGKKEALFPPREQNAAQHVKAVRVPLLVDFNELSPQVEGTPLALIAVTVKRADNGELTLFEANYPTPAIP